MKCKVGKSIFIWIILIQCLCASRVLSQPVTAEFIAGTVCLGEATEFNNESEAATGEIIIYNWDFGDGNSSTFIQPDHTYTSAGTYTVTLTVLSSVGDSDIYTDNVVVNQIPTVSFTLDNSLQCESSIFVFDNGTSGSTGVASWDFGDTNTSTDWDATHVYADNGTYDVVLSAINVEGCSASLIKTIEVYPDPIAEFSVDDVCLGTPAIFDNNSSIESGNISYNWDFDGFDVGINTSTDIEPEYTYGIVGSYEASLTVTSEFGCTTTKTLDSGDELEVFEQPVAEFTYDAVICIDELADLTNATTGLSTAYDSFWEFGDTETSTDQDVSYTYDAPNTFNISLEVTSADGCKDDITKPINVNALPNPDFNIEDVCFGTAITPENTSTVVSGGLTYEWDFGDTGISTDTDPNYTYGLATTYTVTLEATSDFACTNDISKEVIVSPVSNGGTTSGAITLCAYDDTDRTVTVSGHVGEIVRWESSLTNDAPWNSISEESTSITYSNLSEITYYRAIVQSGVCDEIASVVTEITIDPLTDAGEIEGEVSNLCYDNNSGTVTTSDYVGEIVRWEVSTTGPSSGFISESVFTDFYDYSDLEVTTYYRAVIQSGVCNQLTTDVVEIGVAPETDTGLLSGENSVCSGDNIGTISLTGHVGAVLHWEISDTGLEPWSVINSQNDYLEYEDLLFTRYYRAIVQSGDCDWEASNEIIIEVEATTDPGTLIGTSEVCAGVNSGTISIDDNVGDVVRWEYTDNGTDWIDLMFTGESYDFTDLTLTTTYRVWVKNGDCNNEVTDNFEVSVNPLPEVSFDNDEVCIGNITAFESTSYISDGSNESFLWNFGGGSLLVGEEVDFLLPGSGTFPVSLTVTSDIGCVNSETQPVVVNPNPVAGIFFEDHCEGSDSEFTNISTIPVGAIQDYTWGFGDGLSVPSTDENPVHSYAENGVYEVTLTTVSIEGCSNSTSKEIEIYPRATPDFEFENVCFGEEVSFNNNSIVDEGNMFYAWSFGDGLTSTDENPEYVYGAANFYNASLQVTTNNGCVDVTNQTVEVYAQPVVAFEAGNVCADAPVVFENNTSFGAEDLNFTWDFGDTFTSVEEEPSHQYESFGLYTVSLTAESSFGCSNESALDIVIEPLPQVSFEVESVCDGDLTTFENNSTIANGEMTFEWSLGDENILTDEEFEYTYATDGTYAVELTATSEFGCVSSDIQALVIYPNPDVAFAVDNVCDGHETNFTNLTSIAIGTVDSYVWDFGDQTNSIVESPDKLYLNPGIYNVSLLATSDRDCQSIISGDYTVHELPLADFYAEDVCFNEEVQIEDQSYTPDETLRYIWGFGDGNEAFIPEPSNNYELPGVYEISLHITSGNGCQDSLTQNVEVFYLPDAYAGVDTVVSQGFSVQLQGEGGESYFWSPIEYLDHSNLSNPYATPLDTTVFRLEVTDENGCQDYDEVEVSVEFDNTLVPTNIMTPDGNGINDTWIVGNIETFGDANVIVFDRWGNIVFEKIGYQNDWEGTDGTDILPDGTYYYTITFPDVSKNYSGAVTIIRNR